MWLYSSPNQFLLRHAFIFRFTSAPILKKLFEEFLNIFQRLQHSNLKSLLWLVDTGYQQEMGHVCRLLACWSAPGHGHYGLKPVAASVVICQNIGQGDSADCTNPLHPDPITHQRSFPFEKAPFGAGQWSWLMWLKTMGWQYICHLWDLLSRRGFFKFPSAVTTMIPNNANVYQDKKVSML